MNDHNNVNFTSKLAVFALMAMAAWLISACGSTNQQSNPVNQATSVATLSSNSQSGASAEVSFSKDISPILESSCVKCHGVEKVSRGLDLTSYDKAIKGSVRGAVILPGDADNSTLVKLVVDGKMPKQGAKLNQSQIDLIKAWISQGAPNN